MEFLVNFKKITNNPQKYRFLLKNRLSQLITIRIANNSHLHYKAWKVFNKKENK